MQNHGYRFGISNLFLVELKDALPSSHHHTSSKSSNNAPASPTTPTVQSPPTIQNKNGMLTIRVVAAKDLTLPANTALPPSIEKALKSNPSVQSVSPPNSKNRESIQRKQSWWLPYVVLEFDKNEILIDALGGDLSNPVWMYKAHLYVKFLCLKVL